MEAVVSDSIKAQNSHAQLLQGSPNHEETNMITPVDPPTPPALRRSFQHRSRALEAVRNSPISTPWHSGTTHWPSSPESVPILPGVVDICPCRVTQYPLAHQINTSVYFGLTTISQLQTV